MAATDLISALGAVAVATFTGALLHLERKRDLAKVELVDAQPIQNRPGRYKLLVLNRGHHDSSLEYVRVTIHLRTGGDMGPIAPLWVRRTAKHADDVRGLGLMVRSGERLWFTVQAFDPNEIHERAGVSLHVKGVLDKREHSLRLQGATVGGGLSSKESAPDDFEDVD